MQKVLFNVVPTANPDEAVGHARYVYNASNGIGMDILEKIVSEHIPFVDHPEVSTEKTIIHTSRYECPCCNTDLSALVEVRCQGLFISDWKKVEGLYSIMISPNHGGCDIKVEKLSGSSIYSGRCAYLPRKDYESNPDAAKEIADRYKFIDEIARKNPSKVLQVSGIETGGDLGNLIKAVADKFSK